MCGGEWQRRYITAVFQNVSFTNWTRSEQPPPSVVDDGGGGGMSLLTIIVITTIEHTHALTCFCLDFVQLKRHSWRESFDFTQKERSFGWLEVPCVLDSCAW